ncbi:Hypothetical protein D9617_4g002430 [Elsinoe fawcettii]|nr:Hypothetical protein D9617_4g002430 [Elsinoe fawcettii]
MTLVGVLGPSGMGGSHVVVELIARGHRVVGISRNPGKLGQHPLYEPRPVDLEQGSVPDIAATLTGIDVLVCGYGPHSSGPGAMKYAPFLESLRRIILASKRAGVGYFIMLGGCGSLYLPGTEINCVDSPEWWLAFWRGIADSHAHITYMERRFGEGRRLTDVWAYRSARQALREGRDTLEAQHVRDSNEQKALSNDHAKPLITACRTAYLFFEGNTSFRWTFLSPPAMYRSGVKTGVYHTLIDYVPLKGDQASPENLDGRLRGISAADLAVAVADEVEKRAFEGKHWTIWAEQDDVTPAPNPYIDLSFLVNV